MHDIMGSLTGCQLSPATLKGMVKKVAQLVSEVVNGKIKSDLIDSPVCHADETSIRVNGENYWVHTVCNGNGTYLYVHKSRGWAAIEEEGVLTKIKGSLVHDCYKVYDKLDNGHMLRYWLGTSALNDIRCAVFDQASLFMLAERLSDDGDYERAYRYMRFCEKCNTAFSPQLRNYQVRYVANVMEAVCKNSQARFSRLLIVASVGGILLLALVVFSMLRYYSVRRSCPPQRQ